MLTFATWLAIKESPTGECIIVARKESRVAEVCRRYIDEAHIVASTVKRLSV